MSTDFDAVVVGSGFGGSVVTYRLARAGLRVCLLERGKAYPPGSFPRSPHEVANAFWDPSEGLYGLYQLWNFSRISALTASGLGGGSLVYSNVQLRMDEPSLARWPVRLEELEPHYEQVESMMDVWRYPFVDSTPKAVAFKEAADRMQLHWEPAPLAVTFGGSERFGMAGEPFGEPDQNLHKVRRQTCSLAGECNFGCNSGSKNSLDYTYLSAADRFPDTEIRPCCEVRCLRPVDGGFSVSYVEHEPGRYMGRPHDTRSLPQKTVTARYLILSAGALGTPYLLLRNRSAFPGLSRMIGTRFSGNGDFLGFALRSHYRSGDNQVDRIVDPSLGPVITSVVRLPDQPRSHGTAYLEDGGYPDLVNWLVDNNAVIETGRVLRFLARRAVSYLTKDPTTDISAEVARRLISNGAFTATSLPLFGMGCEVPNGRMRLRGRLLDVDWSPKESLPYFRHLNRIMRDFTHQLGGTYLFSPIWILNLLATVHPLGGAPMGGNKDEGVVDPFGRVFDCPGLFIADGSVVPAPVGANPSLTIAALANRTADKVIERWESGSARLEAGAS